MPKIDKTSWFFGLGLPVLLALYLWLWPIIDDAAMAKREADHGVNTHNISVVHGVSFDSLEYITDESTPNVAMDFAASEEVELVANQATSLVNLNGLDVIAYRQMLGDGFWLGDGLDRPFSVKPFVHSFAYSFVNSNGQHHSNQQPFSLFSEVVDSPWHAGAKVLTVAVDVDDQKKYTNQHWVFLRDNTQNYVMVHDLILRTFAKNLKPNDSMAIVGYGKSVAVHMAPVLGSNKVAIEHGIDTLRKPSSQSASSKINALDLAYAQFPKNRQSHDLYTVVWLSNQNFNVGYWDVDSLKNRISEQADAGVFLSVWDSQQWPIVSSQGMAKQFSDAGHNRFVHLEELIFEEDIRVDYLVKAQQRYSWHEVAKDTQLSVHFDPNVVQSYRLITQGNRQGDVLEDGGQAAASSLSQPPVLPIAANSRSGQQIIAMYEIQLTPAAAKQSRALHYGQVDLQYQTPEALIMQKISQAMVHKSVPLVQATGGNQLAIALAGLGQYIKGINIGTWQLADSKKALQQAQMAQEQAWVPMLIRRIDMEIENRAKNSIVLQESNL